MVNGDLDATALDALVGHEHMQRLLGFAKAMVGACDTYKPEVSVVSETVIVKCVGPLGRVEIRSCLGHVTMHT